MTDTARIDEPGSDELLEDEVVATLTELWDSTNTERDKADEPDREDGP